MLLHGSMCELAMRHRQVTAIGEICPTLVTSECMQTTKAILFVALKNSRQQQLEKSDSGLHA